MVRLVIIHHALEFTIKCFSKSNWIDFFSLAGSLLLLHESSMNYGEN